RLEKIIDRDGKFLRLTKEDLFKADAWFERYNVWTVFFCRFIPLIRSLISIPAWMSDMSLGLFVVFATIGRLIWNTIVIYLGSIVGAQWETIVHYMDIYSNIAYAIIALAIILVAVWYIRRVKKTKS